MGVSYYSVTNSHPHIYNLIPQIEYRVKFRMSAVKELTSQEEFHSLLRNPNLIVIHFYAEWATECQPMNEVLETLATEAELKGVMFAKIAAENFPQISIDKKIAAVPTFLIFLSGKQIDRLDGANAAKLSQMVKNNNAKAQLLDAAAIPDVSDSKAQPIACSNPTQPKEDLNQMLKKLINQSTIMLFMKGNAKNPQCGFSRQAVNLLDQYNAEYGTFDIFSNDTVRQGLKTYSDWPTYPQLYIKGEFIGGLDILKEMNEGGELKPMMDAALPAEPDYKALINRAPLMIFMKGNRDEPRCGFSRTLIGILNETGLDYETFDIFSDEDVRQGLKKFSNWPTYPQVYVKGDLVGGLDIIKELQESDELISTLKGE